MATYFSSATRLLLRTPGVVLLVLMSPGPIGGGGVSWPKDDRRAAGMFAVQSSVTAG
jgi:hypothetical protein